MPWLLVALGTFYGLADKIEALRDDPDSEPFIDRERYRRYLGRGERLFRERLAEERAR